jgi:hypothetical protein
MACFSAADIPEPEADLVDFLAVVFAGILILFLCLLADTSIKVRWIQPQLQPLRTIGALFQDLLEPSA